MIKQPQTPSVKYFGPYEDYSGYGEANRNYISALFTAGVDVNCELIKLSSDPRVDHGASIDMVRKAEKCKVPYAVKILHVTPDLYFKNMEERKYNIGHLFWETKQLPPEWRWYCDQMQELWVDSADTMHWLARSGIRPTISHFPQPIDTEIKVPEPFDIGFKGYLFYSIFEWKERKNPRALLETFYKEFDGVSDVALLIKTYRDDYGLASKTMILEELRKIKQDLNLKNPPKVFYLNQLLNKTDMWRIHATGDCFVSTHRGEGWGLPQVEAMLMGKPIISTNRGGVHNYLPDVLAYLISYKEVLIDKVYDKYYAPPQTWAEIDRKELAEAMRHAYTKREFAKKMGERAREFVKSNFSYKAVGEKMKQRLIEIGA